MMYRLNGSWIAVWTIASPTSVLVSLTAAANIRKIGVSSAWYGMISASSRKTKMQLLAGHREARQGIAGGDRQRRA